jgi:hypothetical protein
VRPRFAIGDQVRYIGGRKDGAPDGPYEILACLPREDSSTENRYRVKCAAEANERVISEIHLAAYGAPAPGSPVK